MSNPQQSPAPTATNSTPKVSKFLRPEWRDRQRSSTTDGATMSTSETPSRASRILGKKGSKLFSRNRDEDTVSPPMANDTNSTSAPIPISDPPVIIEPPSNSKPRPRPPRPSTAGDNSSPRLGINTSNSGALSGSSSTRNLGDLPSRLSGWFSHTFSGSSTDLSLPNILSQSNLSPTQMLAGSPRTKTSHPLLTAARHGKDHLDKAMRYLLDSDAQPDRSVDKIWVLGVEHPGYEPPPPPSSTPQAFVSSPPSSALVPPQKKGHRRDSTSSRNKSPSSYRNPIPASHSNSSTQSLSSAVSSSSTVNANAASKQAILWPPDFYSDFTSRVWLTYRNTFPPIRDTSLSSLEPVCSSSNSCSVSNDVPLPSPSKPRWPWSGEKGWTSDAGWGCMLRTGQSLLANSLIHLHLGRGWRRPNQPSLTPEFAQYVRILTWFLDTPSPLAPFGVHRMALAGKELGKEVGSWFGPSTAAGAIKRLVSEFEEAGLEVVLAVDSVVYQSEVYAASNGQKGATQPSKSKHGKKAQPPKWGNRAVLVLVNLRLGIDGVNPIYYDSVKTLFTFPQFVGISGGRPSSSYYFVGSQGDNLFYLDPHHTRPAVPVRPPPPPSAFEEGSVASTDDGVSLASSRLGKRRGSELQMQSHVSTPDTSESEKRSKRLSIRRASVNRTSSSQQQTIPTSPSSVHSNSSFSQLSASGSVIGSHAHTNSQSQPPHSQHSSIPLSSSPLARTSISSPTRRLSNASPTQATTGGQVPMSPVTNGLSQSPSASTTTPLSPSTSTINLDPLSLYLATAYSMSELRTFHCERVRKMPLSGLDPSMLLGFLCRNEQEWLDLRERVTELAKPKKTMFTVQDEPPTWPDDEDELLDLESASDQELEEAESPLGMDDDDEEDDGGLEIKGRHSKLEESGDAKDDSDDDEEDEEEEGEPNPKTPVASSTKHTSSRHDTIVGRAKSEMAAAAAAMSKAAASTNPQSHDRKESRDHDGDDDEDDEDWVDPIKPSPPVSTPSDPQNGSHHRHQQSNSGEGAIPPSMTDSFTKTRGKGEDASVTPTPRGPSHPAPNGSRTATKDLPAIPTTLVSLPHEPASSRSSFNSRRSSQIAISEVQVPFPTQTADHKKQSSSTSSRSTTSSNPTSPGSSPASAYPSSTHGYRHHHHQSSSVERDAVGYPFPGNMTDESGTTSSDSGPSSDAWGGDEKSGMRGSLVPKRERKTTVGRTVPIQLASSPPGSVISSSTHHSKSSSRHTDRSGSVRAKDGGRTTSGGVKAVWNDEDGDDF
ncbi:hypothetical protein CPB86DRAFT_517751 [Serendipita vermifera]|nr:hypothetical protein CPB86DRAFT_517751 [Serendipita vermifera]